MNPEDQEFQETLAMLREAHQEPIAEAHYTAVRARVMTRLETERRPWRWAWAYSLAAVAVIALFVADPLVRAGPLEQPLAVGPVVAHVHPVDTAVDQQVRPTTAKRRPSARRAVSAAYRVIGPPALQPLVVKLVTSDPNVVIYWFTGE